MHGELDLTTGKIWKRMLQFFFPILFGVFFQQLYNTVDSLVVSNFVGKEALAAVGGSAAQIVSLLVGFFFGLASGATVLIAQHFGGKNYHDLKSTIHTAISFAVVGGAILMTLGLIVCKPGLAAMKTPEDTMEYSVQYVRIIFCGVISSLIYNMGSAILQAMGDSRRPLKYLIVCCLTNIVLDLLFVLAFRWEVVGVSVATVLSQTVSAILVLRRLSKLDERYRLRLRELRLRRSDMKGILRIGLPAAIQNSTFSVSNLLMTVCINGLGTDTVAGWTAESKVDSIFWMIMGAFGTTILTFMGQNTGAGNLKRAKKGVKTGFLMTMGTTVVMVTLILVFGRYLLMIFTRDEAVLEMGLISMRYIVPGYVFWVLIEVYSGALRGSGDAFMPMVMNLVGICAVRLVWIFTVVPAHYTFQTICICYPGTWLITGTAFFIYYRSGRWKKLLLQRKPELKTAENETI